MVNKVNVAILGFGVVGSGVYDLLRDNKNFFISHILDRKNRTNISTSNFDDIINDKEVNIIIEVIGGLNPAYEYAKKTLEAKKHFITANKLLVGTYGKELTELARKNEVGFLYDAACGGGIQFLKNIKNTKNTDKIVALGGILNGTTNFILDKMFKVKTEYNPVLREAQKLGYAEADPTSDVEGLDTARKLILSCFIAFDSFVKIDDMLIYGISNIRKIDINYAKENNFTIKLCCYATCDDNNNISAIVEPVLIKNTEIESIIPKNMNYVWFKGKNSSKLGFYGQGAGKLPTASNVVKDIDLVLRNDLYLTSEDVKEIKINNDNLKFQYYLRIPENYEDLYIFLDKKWNYYKQDKYYIFETTKIKSKTIHHMLKNKKDCFFSRINEEGENE